MMELNLGSGPYPIEGWVNIDNTWNIVLSKHKFIKHLLFKFGCISKNTYETDWSQVVKHNLTKRLPYQDNSIDIVYSSHFLEHITRDQAIKFLYEVYRILKPGGLFRITVPDLKVLAERYVHGSIDCDEFMDESLFVPGKAPTFFESFFVHSHKYGYDLESLCKYLNDAGFVHIHECDYRQGRCPDLDKLENHLDSVFVECIKSGR